MARRVLEYRHPAIYVKVGGKTYQFAVCEDRTIKQPALGLDARNAGHAAAVAYLKGCRRWSRDSRGSSTDGLGMKGVSYRAWRWSTD